MATYVLNGPTIAPMTDRDDLFEAGAVIVDDGRIDHVLDAPVSPADWTGAEVLDLTGQVVLPGLVNAHTHLYQALLRSVWEDLPLIPWLERVYATADVLTPRDCYVGTLLGAAENVRSGVTSLCEHQFLNPTFEHTTSTVDALAEIGLRTVYARTVMDRGDIVPASVTEDPEAALASVERLIEAYPTGPMFSVRTGPNTPPVNTSTACCERLASFVEEYPEVGISAHVAESAAVVEQVREEHGVEGVAAYLHDVGLAGPDCVYAHCVHLTGGEVALLAESGTAVSHNPASNMLLGDGVAPLIDMLDRDVTVGLGTDGAASTQTQDMVETMKAASMMHKNHHNDPAVIDAYRILELATVGGARALGLDDHVGTLEPGKRADLVVVDLAAGLHNVTLNDVYSGLVHTMRATDVQHTMVDGEFLMRDRTMLTVDEAFLREEGQRVGRDLVERIEAHEAGD